MVSAQLDAENNDNRQAAEIMIVNFFILFPLFLSLKFGIILKAFMFFFVFIFFLTKTPGSAYLLPLGNIKFTWKRRVQSAPFVGFATL